MKAPEVKPHELMKAHNFYQLPFDRQLPFETGRAFTVLVEMTEAEFEDRLRSVRGNVYSQMSVINLATEYALIEAVDSLRRNGLYRFDVKKLCVQTREGIIAWKNRMATALPKGIWDSYLDTFGDHFSECHKEFTDVRLSLQNILKAYGKTERLELLSWIEMVSYCFEFGSKAFTTIMQVEKEGFKINVNDMLAHMNLKGVGQLWNGVCKQLSGELMIVPGCKLYDEFEKASDAYAAAMINTKRVIQNSYNVMQEHPDLYSKSDLAHTKSVLDHVIEIENEKEQEKENNESNSNTGNELAACS